jgi:LysR family transcriptional regulator, regulator for genes of the gallate degradation pathway
MTSSTSRWLPKPPLIALRELPGVGDRLKMLRCAAAVASHGSAMRAAEAIHLSQPAVTRSVLELERFCGLPLFERSARGMLATPLGALVAQRADALFAQLALGAAQAAALAEGRARRSERPQRFAAAVTPASLKALLAVAATASEAKAAEALGVSQPAVHRSLGALEHLCGGVVFQRSVRGTRLTDAGEALLLHVKLAYGEARAIDSEIAAWRGEIRGRVLIGALPLSVSLLLPRAVDAVLREHPDIEISVVDGTYDNLMRQLRTADIDLVIGALREAPPGVRQETLVEEPLAVVVREGHPLLRRRGLGLAELSRCDWVLPLPGTPASAALRRVFAAAGLAPPPDALQASSAMFTRAIVACTDRLALTSHGQALEDECSGALRRLPVELPLTLRAVGVAWRESGEPSPDLRVVLEALRRVADKQNEYLVRAS